MSLLPGKRFKEDKARHPNRQVGREAFSRGGSVTDPTQKAAFSAGGTIQSIPTGFSQPAPVAILTPGKGWNRKLVDEDYPEGGQGLMFMGKT